MFDKLIRRKEFNRGLDEGHDKHRNGRRNCLTGPEIISGLNRRLAAGMGHRHTGLIRLATPAHLLAALFFLGGKLRTWHNTRHDRAPQEKDRQKAREKRRTPHSWKLTYSTDHARRQTGRR